MIMRSQGELFFSFWESPYEKEPDWFQYLFLLSFGDFFVGYISSLNLKSYESDIFHCSANCQNRSVMESQKVCV